MKDKNKTLIQEIFEKNRGIGKKIAEMSQNGEGVRKIKQSTINKAVKGKKNVSFDTKWEIWYLLGKLGYIDLQKVKVPELFGEK